MKHFTADELKDVLTKLRNREKVSAEELETLKRYVPLHLDQASAERMSKIVDEIRSGKRPPMTPEERAELHQENINITIKNMVETLPTMSDDEFAQVISMCETLRAQIR